MSLRRWLRYELRYAIHPGIWYGLRNLWAYFPLIWRDRDWDWCYMVALWEKKFRRQADHTEKYGHHVGKERDVQQLRLCADLCKRIREDDYEMPAYDAHWKKWHPSGMNLFGTGVERSPLERKEFLRISDSEATRRKADMELLTTMIRKHLRSWWD